MSIRTLYLNHTSQMSGGEHSLMLLLQGLPDETLPILGCPDGPLEKAGKAADVPWVPITGTAGSLKLHPVYTPLAVRDLTHAALEVRQACDELNIDLVHANSIRSGLIAAVARRLGGPPVVAHVRDVLPPGAVSTITGRLLVAGSDVMVANSCYTLEHLPADPARVRMQVVHNPVDLDRFASDRVDSGRIRRELRLDDRVHMLSVVAQITPWKGQDTAIKALAALRESGHRVHLALVGSAKFVDKATRFDNEAYMELLHRLIDDLGLGAQVSFLGERADIPEIMAATDVLLMPSWQEPFGRAIIEAMAVGTAVLATDVGGPPEIVTDGIEGVLVSPDRPEAWVQALDHLLSDPARLGEMGAAGRRRAQAFGVESHVKAILEIYASLVPANRAVIPV